MASLFTVTEAVWAFLPHGLLNGGQLVCRLLDDLLFRDGRLRDGGGLFCHSCNGSRQQLVLLWP